MNKTDRKFDLIVIGGGILGTFHAYHALQKGLKVALLEKNVHPQGATVRNFGQIVPSGMNSQWQERGRRSLQLYRQLQEKTDISVRQQGSVYLASDKDEWTLLHELAEINRASQYPSELLTAQECLDRYPGLNLRYCKGGLFFPEEINIDPRVAVHRILAFLVEQHQLVYLPNTLVQEVSLNGSGCCVQDSSNKCYEAEKVIICNGSDFKNLFPELFYHSDLEVSKLQMLMTVPQPTQRIPGSILTGLTIRRYESFRECPSYAEIKARESINSLVKDWGIHILFKQTEDGSIIIGDSHEYQDAIHADKLGFDLNNEINRCIIDEAMKIFNLQKWRIQLAWFGFYSQCKTKDIFIHHIEDKIHIVTGIGGKGMTAGPALAEENVNAFFGFPSKLFV